MKGKTKGTLPVVTALGMMSGTSLDGVDAALIATDGRTITAIGDGAYRPYTEAERATLRAALGRWPGEAGVAEAAEVVETAHAELLARMGHAFVVGFHGQTLAHDPHSARTHQAGDGAVLAAVTGRQVVWDFRSNDMAMGGQGAPLAPVYHWALAQRLGAVAPMGFLNLGGVGNLTVVDPSHAGPEAPGALIAFDTGPANAPLDDLMRLRTGQACDVEGAAALAGKPNDAILQKLDSHPYLSAPPPKSLDRDSFDWLSQAVAQLSTEDAAATLTEAIALTVARGLTHVADPPERLLVTGGGRHNPAIMAALARHCDAAIDPVEAVELDGDLLEAQAFAFLAVRVLHGLPTSFPGTTGVAASIGGGEISTPDDLDL